MLHIFRGICWTYLPHLHTMIYSIEKSRKSTKLSWSWSSDERRKLKYFRIAVQCVKRRRVIVFWKISNFNIDLRFLIIVYLIKMSFFSHKNEMCILMIITEISMHDIKCVKKHLIQFIILWIVHERLSIDIFSNCFFFFLREKLLLVKNAALFSYLNA